MNTIAVLNLNDFLLPLARNSMQRAADRWGVSFVEITEPLHVNLTHFWQKPLLFFHPEVAKHRRVLYLDCDVLVGDDCPDLFSLVPEGRVGAISRQQPHCHPKYLGLRATERFPGKPYPSESVAPNSGVILFNLQQHKQLLNQWREIAEQQVGVTGGGDQVALALLLHRLQIPVCWLSWKFNAVSPRQIPAHQRAYIYHCTGANIEVSQQQRRIKLLRTMTLMENR